jgi:hypothetical protein
MHADDRDRFRRVVIFCVPLIFLMASMFLMMAIIPATSMAGKNTAGGGEHGDDAY